MTLCETCLAFSSAGVGKRTLYAKMYFCSSQKSANADAQLFRQWHVDNNEISPKIVTHSRKVLLDVFQGSIGINGEQ